MESRDKTLWSYKREPIYFINHILLVLPAISLFPGKGMLLYSFCGFLCNFNLSLSNTLLFNIKNSACLMEQCSMESWFTATTVWSRGVY